MGIQRRALIGGGEEILPQSRENFPPFRENLPRRGKKAYVNLHNEHSTPAAHSQSPPTKNTKLARCSGKALSSLCWGVFVSWEHSHGFAGAFLGFSRVRTASLVRFRASRVCARLPWRVFGLRAYAHGFAGAFSGRGALPSLRLARFRPSGASPRPTRSVSGLKKYFRGFLGTVLEPQTFIIRRKTR